MAFQVFGGNEEFEIETYDEFRQLIDGHNAHELSFKSWIFQEVDFSSQPIDEWKEFHLEGAFFLGCTFPEGILRDFDDKLGQTPSMVRERGATVFENPPDLPFKPFRAFMYRQEELIAIDEKVYNYYKEKHDVISVLNQSFHDYSIQDALGDFLEGKSVVAIMGGHSMKRTTASYRQVVYLARSIARLGFVVATGGGPGAMEAANLGAYLRDRSDEEVEEALRLLSTDSEKYPKEYENIEAANLVLKRFGLPTHMPSLGIPTWHYGHEPPNRFATWQAKFFSNAIREAGLIAIANGGIIYCPGGAGTRQEIFQDACRNHYGITHCPMIFLNVGFWKALDLVELIKKTSEDRPYKEWILSSDSEEEILAHLEKYRNTYSLPVVTDEHLTAKFWMKNKDKPIQKQLEKKKVRPTIFERTSFPFISQGKRENPLEHLSTFIIGAGVGLLCAFLFRKIQQ